MTKILNHDLIFSPEIAYGATGGPEFSTDIVTSSNGYEYRNVNWLQARNKYNLAPAIKTKDQLEYLINFFRSCQGRANPFRFKDWVDYKINNQLIATADGETKEFQLVKSYHHSIRKISKPIINTIRISIGGKIVNPKIDHLTGIIKFEEAPDEGMEIRAEGEFDVLVRFDTDHLITSIENYGVYSHYEIPLIEIKL